MMLSTVVFHPGHAGLDLVPRLPRGPASLAGAWGIGPIRADRVRLTVAVPGFGRDDLTVTAQPGRLVVRGRRMDGDAGSWFRSLAFERRFALDRYAEVRGARLESGVLTIELARELPEALRPRVIPVSGPNGRRERRGFLDRFREALKGLLDRASLRTFRQA